MKNTILINAMLVLMATLFAGCIEEYEIPESEVASRNELYARGEIKLGAASYLSLQRTMPFSQTGEEFVRNARVRVVGDNGFKSNPAIYYTDLDLYIIDTYDAKPNGKYRMEITLDGEDYASNYMEMLETPEISRLYYEVNKNKGVVEIYADVDQLNDNMKYMWTYEEDFEVKAPLKIYNKVFDGGYIRRYDSRLYKFDTDNSYHINCWANQRSTTINLYSASRNEEPIIKRHKVAEVRGDGIKFDGLYCITVYLNAISSEAFAFYTELHRLTEQDVSLYPPMPTDLRGNMECLTSSKMKMRGMVSSSVPTTKRLFIDREEVEDIITENYGQAFVEATPNNDYMAFLNEVVDRITHGYLVWSSSPEPIDIKPTDTRYYYPWLCNCEKRGGTHDKPLWWPN